MGFQGCSFLDRRERKGGKVEWGRVGSEGRAGRGFPREVSCVCMAFVRCGAWMWSARGSVRESVGDVYLHLSRADGSWVSVSQSHRNTHGHISSFPLVEERLAGVAKFNDLASPCPLYAMDAMHLSYPFPSLPFPSLPLPAQQLVRYSNIIPPLSCPCPCPCPSLPLPLPSPPSPTIHHIYIKAEKPHSDSQSHQKHTGYRPEHTVSSQP